MKKGKTPETITGKISYQRGACVLYFNPEEVFFQEGTRVKFSSTGRIFQTDEEGKQIIDELGRRMTVNTAVSLVGNVRNNFGGWGLHVGQVSEWELLDGESVEATDLVPGWLGE